MKALFEFSGFLGLATALHLGLLSTVPEMGAQAGGEDAVSAIALAASSPELNARVQEWERPPEQVNVAAPTTPPQMASPPPMDMAMPDRPVSDLAQPLGLAGLALPAGLPALDLSVPPPPEPKPDVMASRRPKLRPMPEPAPVQPASPRPEPPLSKPPEAKPTEPKPSEPTPKEVAKPAPQKPVKPAKPALAQTASKPAVAAGAGKADQSSKPGRSAKKLMAQWGGQIRVAIERRKRYPSGTRSSGTVRLAVAVHSSGRLTSVRVSRSSGDARLDKAALLAVSKARFRAAPKGLKAGVHKFTLPMSFRP